MIRDFDYLRMLPDLEPQLTEAFQRVLRSGQLVLGPETELFEKEFATFVGVKHCVGVNSGTTALELALRVLQIGSGDEVITAANTCAPTAAAIRNTGARPVFVDVRDSDLMMDEDLVEKAVGARTRAIVPVHLWGQGAPLLRLQEVADQHGLQLIEDCAQAHGTKLAGHHVGTSSDAGCFSFYPTKNLGCYGEAGAIVTNNDALADELRRARQYGYDKDGLAIGPGTNARIAEIQAALLRVKLRSLPDVLKLRSQHAQTYRNSVANAGVRLPAKQTDVTPSLHQFVVRSRDRDRLRDWLAEHDIRCKIHYPTPLHKMPAFAQPGELPVSEHAAQEILSLPIHEALTVDEIQRVASVINAFSPATS